jgi:hypothetical protein
MMINREEPKKLEEESTQVPRCPSRISHEVTGIEPDTRDKKPEPISLS